MSTTRRPRDNGATLLYLKSSSPILNPCTISRVALDHREYIALDVRLYVDLQEILEDYITSKDAWNVEGDTITITELGTIHLLEKLGIIEILYARS